MRDECPNCGGDLQAIDERGSRIACTDCAWMKTPYFEGLPIGSSDDGFEGKETTEDVPEKAERPIQFEVPSIVEDNASPTELRALKELLRFDDRSKSEIAEDLDVNIGSVSAASGRYEYFRQNGYFDGPELEFDGDISNYDPSRNRYKKYQKGRRKSAGSGTMKAQAQSLAEENPEMSYSEIAETVGYKKHTDAVQVTRDFDGGYKFERFSPMRQDILKQMKQGDVDYEALAEKYDTTITEISANVGSAQQFWIDDVEIPGVDVDTEPEFEVETETELETEFEPELETEVEIDRTQIQPGKSNGEVQIVMPKPVVVDLIIEGTITDENRRKIVEQLVS